METSDVLNAWGLQPWWDGSLQRGAMGLRIGVLGRRQLFSFLPFAVPTVSNLTQVLSANVALGQLSPCRFKALLLSLRAGRTAPFALQTQLPLPVSS